MPYEARLRELGLFSLEETQRGSVGNIQAQDLSRQNCMPVMNDDQKSQGFFATRQKGLAVEKSSGKTQEGDAWKMSYTTPPLKQGEGEGGGAAAGSVGRPERLVMATLKKAGDVSIREFGGDRVQKEQLWISFSCEDSF
ncbi:Multisite-specific tRNA:(cytosine-C(5))-methyltransferase [Varanus komodoensis]|nr:Multisite-specific tRNA:(cytosine-C(5))-methyltransferase [Varanus komodoensis]